MTTPSEITNSMVNNPNPKYVIVTPVRDEEKYLETTIQSVIAQTIQPAEWIIVDDGSTDRTPEIIAKYAALHPWIRSRFRTNRGFRKSGAGVVEAFYDGYDCLQTDDWDFVVKLDGDLSFDAHYFENAFKSFSEQPRLGICGGSLYHNIDGALVLEENPRFHVRGATKIYRKDCWIAIGGLERAPGWDSIDEVKANMLGWTTESLADVQAVHHRFTGTAESKWRDAIKNGQADYFAGYHPLFMAVKCVYRLSFKPYIILSLGMAYGFIGAYLRGMPQVSDRAVIKYVRREQLRRLCGAETIWK